MIFLCNKFTQKLFVLFQYICPKVILTKILGSIARCKIVAIKNLIIIFFVKYYGVNLQEAEFQDIKDYNTFNEFFTRNLKKDARPLQTKANELASPADGVISQFGDVTDDKLIQAKGFDYDLKKLLGNDNNLVNQFKDSSFITIYLSPKDYHKVHMPYSGYLEKMIYIPGELFSVNNTTANNIDNLFTRNERVVCVFDTKTHGKMTVIFVGAMIVGSISTSWHNQVYYTEKQIKTINYDINENKQQIFLQQGEEVGFFELGSTVIVLFDRNNQDWNSNIKVNAPVKVNQALTHKSDN
jgi:phosphatidylserine decarboxylase